jgi:ferredoxin
MVAAATGKEPVVRLLLSRGVPIDACCTQGKTALMEGCAAGAAGVVAALLEKGPDLLLRCTNGETALTYACRGGCDACFSSVWAAMITCFTSVWAAMRARTETWTAIGQEVLPLACQLGRMRMVRQLVECGVNPAIKPAPLPSQVAPSSAYEALELFRQAQSVPSVQDFGRAYLLQLQAETTAECRAFLQVRPMYMNGEAHHLGMHRRFISDGRTEKGTS